MTSTLADSYKALSDLNLWLKVQSGDTLLLSDVPSILPLRWNYFKLSWEYIKPDILAKVPSYQNPDFLNEQINDFTSFIESQRNSGSKVNPLSDSFVVNRFYSVFDVIEIASIRLNNEEEKIVGNAITRVNLFSKNDFIRIKNTIRDYRDRYTDTIALQDTDYNQTFNRSSIPAQVNATIVDTNYILTLQQGIRTCDFILANYFATDVAIDPFALARANANNPDVNIGQYSSGRLVKMNYGEDLEKLAVKYLGDANRWIDIAIANGLKPPYIDEVGEQIPLKSNASGTLINLNGTDVNGNLNIDKVYINQIIFLKSDTEVIPSQRKIINIRQIPVSDEIIIEVDGDPDLSKFQISDNASIRVYKPNTINSSFYVLIPTNDPLTNSRKEEVPWFLANAAEDEKQAKIDLAVDDSGDLILAPNGDLKISFGLDNAIQAIKFKLSTEFGSLRYHPTYGLVNVLGNKNNDINNIITKITDSLNSQIEADERFERIESLDVRYRNDLPGGANIIMINMAVRLAGGGDKVIPISFTINV